jgi:putative (di)nucleoside polyphosphate hydrolase
MMAETQRFRANVGIVVLNAEWKGLALERIDKKQLKAGVKRGTGQWQMPQGGLDEVEEPDDAWVRELREEVGLRKKDVDLIGRYPGWLTYELPTAVREDPAVKAKQGRGQAQTWYFVRLRAGAAISVETDKPQDQEFVALRWVPLGQLAEETWEVRRPIYLKLALHLGELMRAS